MFRIYIHILEVLAMHTDGTFADNIHAWGSCFEKKDIEKGLKSLLKEGFVNKTMLGKVRIWHITDKALEYCETVVRKHDRAVYEEEALKMHSERKKANANPHVGVVPGAYEELPQNMVVSGDYVFSVDDEGIPDHVYIGLANDDGSLPFDAIVSDPENVASEGTQKGFLEPSEMDSDVTILTQVFSPSEPIVGEPKEAYGNPEEWEFEICPDCGNENKYCYCYEICEDCGHMGRDCWC